MTSAPPPSPFVEREAEHRALREALDGAVARRASVVVLEGTPGIGKTRLLDEALTDAPLRVARGRCGPLERDAPFALALELLAPLIDAHIGPLSARAARAWAGLEGEGDLTERGFGRTFGLYWLLHELAATGPLAVVVDDAHWADEPTARWLGYAASRLDGLPVALVLATRTGAGGKALKAVLSRPDVVRLAPAPLTAAGVGQLLRAVGADDRDAERCRAATGGVPLLVRELSVRPIRDRGGEPSGLALGDSVQARLALLPQDVRRLAEAAAILDDGALVGDAGALARLDPHTAATAADALVRADVLDVATPIRFAHPLVRQAIVEGLGAARRAADHGLAAAILHARGASEVRVATHVIHAEPAGEGWRAAALQRAAGQSIAGGSVAQAVQLLTRALAEPPAPEDLSAILRDRGLARTLLGDGAGAADLRAAIPGLGSPNDRADAGRLIARALLHGGEPGEALDVLREVADAVDPVAERERRLLLEGDLCGVALQRTATVRQAYERASRHAQTLTGATPGERVLLGALAAAMDSCGEPIAVSWPSARLALAGGRMAVEQMPDGATFYRCCDLAVDGEHFDLVDPALQVALDDARDRGSLGGLAMASAFRAHSFLLQGRLAEAEAEAQSAVAACTAGGWSLGRPFVDGTYLGILADRGDLRLGEEMAQEAVDPGEGHRLSGFILYHRGRLRLAQGRAAEAEVDLRELGHRVENGDLRFQHWPWRALLARAIIGRGRDAEAETLAREEVDLRAGFSARWQVTARRALGLVLGGTDGIAELQDAAELAAGAAGRHDHAAVLVDLGAAQRRAGHVALSREPLAAGLEIATDCGALGCAERARVELRAAGMRPRRAARTGVDSLTASELRVAKMAAEGAANHEIAQALFVTVKTVEKHLGAAYAKLGVTRSELARQLTPVG